MESDYNKRLEALRNLAERPGTPEEGNVAKKMLNKHIAGKLKNKKQKFGPEWETLVEPRHLPGFKADISQAAIKSSLIAKKTKGPLKYESEKNAYELHKAAAEFHSKLGDDWCGPQHKEAAAQHKQQMHKYTPNHKLPPSE